MQDLIQELKDKAQLTEEQAHKSLEVVRDYIHSKVPPMFSGVVDNFLGSDFKEPNAGSTHANNDFLNNSRETYKKASQKVEDIANEVKEETEHFAKEAKEHIGEWTNKAEKAAKEAVDKLKNIIEENKRTGNKS